jgi:hypothetical protein
MEMGKALHMNDILNSPLNKPVESTTFTGAMKILQNSPEERNSRTPGMRVHIEITKTSDSGEMNITADICNADDLETFWIKTEEYMPRPGNKIVQRLREMFRR